jgi:hypothetical protein
MAPPPIAIYFLRNVIHCFNLFPSSDTAVGNDHLNEVRQQKATGPRKKISFLYPSLPLLSFCSLSLRCLFCRCIKDHHSQRPYLQAKLTVRSFYNFLMTKNIIVSFLCSTL